MEDWLAMLLLAIVQGIAEWFPISSSGHLVLLSELIGYTNTLTFDVALHFGTLMAVFVYFGKDITEIIRALLSGNVHSEYGKMGVALIIATIPAGIVGFFFHRIIEESLGNLSLLAFGLVITSLFLFIGSISKPKPQKKRISYRDAFVIGMVQVVSLLRGVSRSGSTISTGLLLGLSERTAVVFSFLLSIPIVFGANILVMGGDALPKEYFWAALVSFFVGLATIHVLLKFILTSRRNLRWFGWYVLAVAIMLIIYLVST